LIFKNFATRHEVFFSSVDFQIHPWLLLIHKIATRKRGRKDLMLNQANIRK
jgi:hypothetical protein